MTERKFFWRGHGWVKWVAGGLLLALIVAAVAMEIGLRRAEPFLRARIVEALENRFHARVELDGFHISLVNGLWAEGKGLRIWPPMHHPKDEDLSLGTPEHVNGVTVAEGQGEPLVRLEEFRFHAPLRYRVGVPIHISLVELKGLSVYVPPKSHLSAGNENGAVSNSTLATKTSTSRGWGTQQNAGPSTSLRSDQDDSHGRDALDDKPKKDAEDGERGWGTQLVSFDVERIECAGAELVIETDKPGKMAQEFAITRLTLTGIAKGGAIGFDVELTNPRPKGTVKATGNFAPLNGGDLGAIPMQGEFRLEKADLASFKGIAGTVDATGHFQGTLRELTVDGETRTPDFRLTHFGNAVALMTRFHAQVDGTNGDTWLEPVEATLGGSHFTAQGSIVRVRGAVIGGAQQYGGHDIALTVNVERGRIEDFLRLASKTGKVLLTGEVALKTSLRIPPGPAPVHERLKLDGWFALEKALFTNDKMQRRIAELSLRGQGRPEDLKTTDPASILSQMQSSFQLGGGVITLPALSYSVSGATIQLKGTYGLEDGALQFDGAAKMEASVSKMVGGWMGMLLKPADRMMKKDGAGTEVPIEIGGTREKPEFTIEFDRMKISRGGK
ncbi:MAG: AsmA-like C-terminal region-containing protein [Terracidiphilus sp.]